VTTPSLLPSLGKVFASSPRGNLPTMATGVDAKLLKSTKFPLEFNQKVDMQKVNLQVMKKWIASKISDILGS